MPRADSTLQTNFTRHTSIESLTKAAEAIDGEPSVKFIDQPWSNGRAGDIDLFHEFSERSGTPIGLREVVIFVDCRPIVLFLIVRSRAEAFIEFLHGLIVSDEETGGLILPGVIKPGESSACLRASAAVMEILTKCNVIVPLELDAYEPAAVKLKLRIPALCRRATRGVR